MSAKPLPALRLDRLLSNMGYGSRREVQALIDAELVSLDGALITRAETKISITADLSERMRVRGGKLDPPPGFIVLLHKPLGVTCSHKDAGPLVYSLFPPRWGRREPPLSTVGRLDKDTSGLLLLTDDGDLLHRIISPRKKVTKRYRAGLARPLTGDETAIFASGALLLEGDDKPVSPALFRTARPARSLADRDRRALSSGAPHVRRHWQPCGKLASRSHWRARAARRLGGRPIQASERSRDRLHLRG